MKNDTIFSSWIRSGGLSNFHFRLGNILTLEKKFTVVPDRLLESVLADALEIAVQRLNQFLPENASINISSVETDDI